MNRSRVRIGVLLVLLAWVLTSAPTGGQEASKEQGSDGEKPAAQVDPAVLAKLIAQLRSDDFRTREKASQQLTKLDEVPEVLRHAAKDADLEVARRARSAITIIRNRAEEKAFQRVLRRLHQLELDRFVRRMVTDNKFASEQKWKIIQAVAKAVTTEANKIGRRRFKVSDFAIDTMPHLLFNGETRNRVSVGGTALLSAGTMPYITGVSNSLVLVDGDFTGATGINNSLLIVRGNVGYVTSVTDSIILATGYWQGATSCRDSLVQVKNHRIRFTSSRDSVLIDTAIRTTGDTNSQVLHTDKGPLRLLKFSPRPSDAQLVWSPEVNNLAVAITSTCQKDQFLIRWKNIGKDALQLPWVRLNSHVIDSHRDDLLDHVFLKGPDGKRVPARQYATEQHGRLRTLDRAVVLGPGQTHEETIDLWSYVKKPAVLGKYQLSIELDISERRRAREHDVPMWSGKIQSKVIEVSVGK
jgi:hypothetical protein